MTKPRYRSTHPSRYYSRPLEPTVHWKSPSWIERNGEFIAAMLGAIVIAGCLGAIVGALVAGWLS